MLEKEWLLEPSSAEREKGSTTGTLSLTSWTKRCLVRAWDGAWSSSSNLQKAVVRLIIVLSLSIFLTLVQLQT